MPEGASPAQAPVPAPRIFARNLGVLEKSQPALARALRNTASLAPHAIPAADGGFSVRTGGADGAWVASRRAPLAEAQRLAAEPAPKALQVLLVTGIGTGHAVAALLGRLATHRAVILEHRLGLIRLALEHIDFSEALASRRLAFACDIQGQTVAGVLEAYADGIGTYGYCPMPHPYTAGDIGYSSLMAAVGGWVKQVKIAIESAFAGGRIATGNVLDNLRYYLRNNGAIPFRSALAGQPAVLVAAGPSLARNLYVLKQYSGRVYVHAVSSALKRVLDAGVEVHSTNVVDYHHLSVRYFDGIPDAPPLWSQMTAHPSVLDSYSGPLVLCESLVTRRMLTGVADDHGDFQVNSSNVAHHAYQILRFMGCSPIILIGLDQANSFHISHAPGTAYFDELAGSSHRFRSLEMDELIWCTSKFDQAGVDVYGNPLTADPQMTESAIRFETMFAASAGTRIINATEGGRKLRNAEDMTLADALAATAKRPPDMVKFKKALEATTKPDPRIERNGLKALHAVRDAGDVLAAMLERVERVLVDAAAKLADGQPAPEMEPALHELNEFVRANSGLYENVTAQAAADVYRRRQRQQDAMDPALSATARERIRAEYEAEYLSALRRALGFWQAGLLRGIARAEGKEPPPELIETTPAPAPDTNTAGGSSRVSTTVDAIIQFCDDAAANAAFCGSPSYSPLAIALRALLDEPRIRRVIVPLPPADADHAQPDFISPIARNNPKVLFLPALPPKPYSRRDDVRKLHGWNHTGALRGAVMSTVLGTEADPTQLLDIQHAAAATGLEPAPFILAIPPSIGFLTPDVVASLLDCGRFTNWEQAFYTVDGPDGLVPFIWERATLEQVRRENTPSHIVFHQICAFWGKSFGYMPTWAVQCRRSFALGTARGRGFAEAVASRLDPHARDGSAPAPLRAVVDAGNACFNEWTGDCPRDLEIEITTRRGINPIYLPRLSRLAADMTLDAFTRIVAQLAPHRNSVNLTLGGHGDPLEHPELLAFIAAARPHVHLINLRTFGLSLTTDQFEQLRAAGVDALTVRLGGWGREAYTQLNGADHFERIATTLIEIARRVLQSGKQTPLIVPEVVKALAGDKTLLDFRHAWWSPATWPNVLGCNTWDGAIEQLQAISLFPRTRQACFRVSEQMMVFADGSVPLCAQDFDARHPVGNLTRDTLRDVWLGARVSAVRRAHAEGDWSREHSPCGGCNEWFRLG